ncbi:lambda-crystallin homolog isoform 2-T2 [Spinachia spinachia]
MSSSDMKIITVIGSGLIGRSWAMVFVSGGHSVKIYDNQPGASAKAVAEIRKQLQELQEAKMLRGQLTATQQLALLSGHDELAEALQGAFFVQECVFEQLQVKQDVFRDIERLVGEDVVLSSSTSCLVPSKVFSTVQNRSRCLVSHPVNPPYYVRLVELVPHPDTAAAVMDAAYSLMTTDGVLSVKDIDLVMSEGLGMRYAFIGPMETMHLNAPDGLEDYMKRYGEGIRRMLTSFGPVPDFSGTEGAQRIVDEMSQLIPSERQHLSARVARRDQLLMGLAKLKQEKLL